MNLDERAACDGLAPDQETSLMSDMGWLCEHVERLQWELESTSRELLAATEKLRKGGSET